MTNYHQTIRTIGNGGVHKDGHTFPLEAAIRAVHTERGDLVLAALTDVSARYAAMQREAMARALFQSVIDAANEFSIIASDSNGLITVFNSGAERLLGYCAAEMVGKQIPIVLHDPEEVRCRSEILS